MPETAIISHNNKYGSNVPSGRKNGAKSAQPHHHQQHDKIFGFTKKIRELRLELEIRKREEERIEKDIAIILEESSVDGGEQNRSFGLSVTRLNNHMLVVENQAKQLTNTLKNISSLADTISGRVSALDVAKTRVVNCLQLASDMKDLGHCAEHVNEAIRDEDVEQAAQYIHRFLTLDQSVFHLREFKDATDSIRQSYEVLSLAKERFLKILNAKMDDAVKKVDVAEMGRFVKLFPMINESESGLNKFGVYICQCIDKLSNDNLTIMKAGGTDDNRRNVLYADTLFMFFDGISGIIEANLAILENSYGLDKLLDFMFILQTRIDDFFRRLLEEFDKKRKVSSIMKLVSANLYKNAAGSEVDSPDPNEIDQIVTEVCLMNSSVELYWRFIGRRVGSEKNLVAEEQKDFDDFGDLDEQEQRKELVKKRAEQKKKKLDQLLNRSLVGTKMQELIGHYIMMENYYMQKSVQKAMKMDLKDLPDDLISSINDDVVFIVRKCIRRSASSGNVDSVCATINNAISILDTTIHHYFNQHISEGYLTTGFASEALATAQTAFTTAVQGKQAHLTPEKKKELFLLAVNNASRLGELLKELAKGLVAEWSGVKRPDVEKSKLEHSTTQIEEVAMRLVGLGKHGVTELFKADFKKKLREFRYAQNSHQLTMEDLEHYAANDPFIDYYMSAVQNLLDEYKDILSTENYQIFLLNTCTEIARIFEKNLMVCQFNRYGTLQLDRDYRNLVGFLTKHAGWVVREKCSRLDQIVSLLNVETVEEAVELWHSSKSFPGRSLTLMEVKRVLALRVDLPSVAVQGIEA